MLVEVAIKNSSSDYDRLYTYSVPERIGQLHPGALASVGFGNRKNVEAVVVNTVTEKDDNIKYEIRDIDEVISQKALLKPEMVRILNWMKKRYFCTYYDILRLMLPLSLVKRKKVMKTAFLALDRERALEIIQSDELKNIRHIRVIENLIENEFLPVSELCAAASVSPAVIKTLSSKGFINIEDRIYERVPDILSKDFADNRPELNPDQKRITDKLTKKIGSFSQELIYGVTGSGKTEVYLRLIEETIARGLSSLVLVPEIALTPQMVAVLRGRFGDSIAIIHSKLSAGERYDSWQKIYEGDIKIVVGARSAVFAPLENIGLIVVDEEHEASYKSETTPRYNAKEVALKRAVANDSLLVLGSATPLVESFYKARAKDRLHMLPKRAAAEKMPDIYLVDMKEEQKNGNMSILSSMLVKEMHRTLGKNEKVMLLLNRRGFNNILLCEDCGKVYECINCSVAMRYHSNIDRLICHHCGYTIRTEECRYCKGSHLKGIGYGTQYLETEIKKGFSGIPLFRLDADTQGIRGNMESILETFKNEKAAILVGTQLIAKGHDIEDVTLVGVLNADMVLTTDDFRASERTFSLISQVSGRAGRGKLHGSAVIQSLETDDYSIKSAAANDYLSFFENEIKIRKILGYPPFMVIGLVELRSVDKKLIEDNKQEIFSWIKQCAGECEIIGPYDPYITTIARRHRARILLKSKSLGNMLTGLRAFDERHGKKIRSRGIGLMIDIDPYQILF